MRGIILTALQPDLLGVLIHLLQEVQNLWMVLKLRTLNKVRALLNGVELTLFIRQL